MKRCWSTGQSVEFNQPHLQALLMKLVSDQFGPAQQTSQRQRVRDAEVVTDKNANAGMIAERQKHLLLDHVQTGKLDEGRENIDSAGSGDSPREVIPQRGPGNSSGQHQRRALMRREARKIRRSQTAKLC